MGRKARTRLLAGVVGLIALGTTVSGAHSLVWPMLIDAKIEERVTTIFTAQNQVSAALAEKIIEAEVENVAILDALYAVEEQLNDACAPVQEAGRRHIDGEALSGMLQINVFNTMDDCEAKTEEVAYYVRLARDRYSEAFGPVFDAAAD